MELRGTGRAFARRDEPFRYNWVDINDKFVVCDIIVVRDIIVVCDIIVVHTIANNR